eukprot:TRINITY_DN28711_c0_g1_i1.p1 TRINITY_DN28711_c0_g1~~TRINITY_DN28711_c0_g1_i1.p1  ORF type:complete len:186 (+),score=43.60 TRINITY_DN28711_c0_g1_i1:38-595(+)
MTHFPGVPAGLGASCECQLQHQLPRGIEIGKYATWSVSTAKHGNGVQQLRDGLESTYWQSDGTQPHLVDVQWNRSQSIVEVQLYMEHSVDESYTPRKLVLRAGNTYHDLQEIGSHELNEPEGWLTLPCTTDAQNTPTHASLLQIAIQENHQNGRDTHLRQVRVIGPPLARETSSASTFSLHAGLR